MQVAKQIDGVVTIADLTVFYPNTSFPGDGPPEDFVEQEGIYFIDNSVPFDPTTQKLVTVEPYLDGQVVRTIAVVPLTQQELDTMRASKSGEVINDFKREASRKLDEFAQSRGYDSIATVVTYAASTEPDYYAEAQRAIYLRDRWWKILTTMLNEVLAGTRPLPASFSVLEAELPPLTWEA